MVDLKKLGKEWVQKLKALAARIRFPCTHSGLKLSITPVPRDLLLSSSGTARMHMMHVHPFLRNTHTHMYVLFLLVRDHQLHYQGSHYSAVHTRLPLEGTVQLLHCSASNVKTVAGFERGENKHHPP